MRNEKKSVVEKIEGKLQSSEADKNVLRGNQRFTKNETEMIFEHFKRFLDTETIPRKQDIIPFIEENKFQADAYPFSIHHCSSLKVQCLYKTSFQNEICPSS